MKNDKKELVLVSACLVGMPCRWDGGSKLDDKAKELFFSGRAIVVCPEILAGLPTPRPACELCLRSGQEAVIDADGNDYTKEFIFGAAEGLAIAKKLNIKKAYLKSGSPSCGAGTVFDGTFTGNKKPGYGLFAKMLIENGIEVEELK